MTLSTHLELGITKISLILGITILLGSCNAVKNVTQDQLLLTKNTIEVDGQKVDDFGVFSQLTQRPNTKIPLIGIPAGLHLYNLADQQPDRLALTQDNTLATWYQSDLPLWFNYWDGYGFQNIYGLPSGSPFVGSFNIDDSNGVVLLNQYFNYSYLMIEYLSSGNPDEPFRIPIQFREALLSFLAWRDIASMPSTRKGNLGDKRDRKQEFYNQRRIANAQFKPLYLMQAYEQNLDTQRMTVKA